MNLAKIRQAQALLAEAYASEPVATIGSPVEVIALPAVMKLMKARQEHFMVITLDGAHAVIKARIVTSGLVNRTVVHPREVFAPAITDNAVAVILVHNHPSGKMQPSEEDREITSRLDAAGELLGIQVLDHIIVGKSGYYSFKETGGMK